MSTRLIVLTAALCAIAAAVAFVIHPEGAPAASPPRLHFVAGQQWAYQLDWQAQTSGQITGGPDSRAVGMQSHVEGALQLEVVSAHPEGAQLAVRFSTLERFDFSMQGQAVSQDLAAVRADLVGQPAYFELDGRGRVSSLAFPPAASPTLRATMRAVVLELGFTLPEQTAPAWDAAEPNGLGSLRAHYVRSGSELVRTPIAYTRLDAAPGEVSGPQELSGHTVFALDPEGGLYSVEDEQRVTYRRSAGDEPSVSAHWSFMLHRTAAFVGAVAAAPADLSAQPLQGTIADQGLSARRDARLAKQMSLELLALTVERFEAGTRPGHEFLVRAGAFLRLHPEANAALVAQFCSPTLTVKGRGLVLDILVEAGDLPAQAAMREALADPAAHGRSTDYSKLVQRFTFVADPSPESIDFLASEARRARQSGDLLAGQGAVVALGSSVRRLQDGGDLARAQTTNDRLRQELEAVKDGTPLQKRGILAALGNTARAENVDAIVGFAHDSDLQVRDQVASALRQIDSTAARSTLLSLAAEGSTLLSISAFSSLRGQSLDATDWAQLARLAREGKTPIAADGNLVDLVRARRAEAGASGREILQVLQRRNRGGENDLGLIIEQLLAEG